MPDSNPTTISKGESSQAGAQRLSGFCASTCEDAEEKPITIESLKHCRKESEGRHLPMFKEPNPVSKGWEWNTCKLCKKPYPIKKHVSKEA